MTAALLLLEIGVPLLALASIAAIAWVRRQDSQVRGQAASLSRRLERELSSLIFKGQRIRLRIGLAVELYCGGKPAKAATLASECEELLAYLESLQAELLIQSGHLPGLGRRELRAAHGRIVALANEGRDLATELDMLDKFWTRELDGMTAARPTGAPSTRFARPVLH